MRRDRCTIGKAIAENKMAGGKIISFINLKGGCGKSTSAVHAARYLLSKKRQVCLVDADAQETSSRWIANLAAGIPRPHVERFLDYDVLLENLPELVDRFERVVVDGAGGIAEIQRAALQVADLVLVPVKPTVPDFDAAAGTAQNIAAASKVRERYGYPPIEARFFFCLAKGKRSRTARDLRDVIPETLSYPLLKTEIPDRVAIADCMGLRQTLFDAKDASTKALAKLYANLFKEAGIDE